MTAKQQQLQLIRSSIEIAQQLNHRSDARTLMSLLRQRERKKLSPRQENFLQVLVDRNDTHALEERKKGKEAWVAEWEQDTELQEKATVIAKYYSRSQYYKACADTVLAWMEGSSTNLPPKRAIMKMVENKYAEKVWQSHTALPKWAVGDMVTLRTTLKGNVPRGFRSDKGWYGSNPDTPIYSHTSFMVIAVDSKPIDKALTYNKTSGGSRYYKLLPVGMAQPIDVMECDIKKLLKRQTQ